VSLRAMEERRCGGCVYDFSQTVPLASSDFYAIVHEAFAQASCSSIFIPT
jgi:hypothetical protein